MNKLDLIREKREVFEKTLVTSREEDFIFGNGIFFLELQFLINKS